MASSIRDTVFSTTKTCTSATVRWWRPILGVNPSLDNHSTGGTRDEFHPSRSGSSDWMTALATGSDSGEEIRKLAASSGRPPAASDPTARVPIAAKAPRVKQRTACRVIQSRLNKWRPKFSCDYVSNVAPHRRATGNPCPIPILQCRQEFRPA